MNKIFVSINYLVSYLGHPPPIYRHNGRSCQIYFRTQGVWLFSQTTIMQSSVHSSKVEKIVKGSLDWIPSPSPSVKIMGGKVYLRCKGKTFLGWCQQTFWFQKFVDNAQQCFALLFQVKFPANNLNFSWRWRDWIQAIFLNLFYFTSTYLPANQNLLFYSNLPPYIFWCKNSINFPFSSIRFTIFPPSFFSYKNGRYFPPTHLPQSCKHKPIFQTRKTSFS